MKPIRSISSLKASRRVQSWQQTSSQYNPSIFNTLSRPLPQRQSLALARSHSYSTYSSIDPNEVTHFTALASSWWDPHGPSRLLHLMNPLRHTFINRLLLTSHPDPPLASLRYLDIGCGGGIFAESAARLPTTHSVTAIDPTPEVLKVAEAHKRQDPSLVEPGRLSYVNTSIEKLQTTAPFDVVSCFEVIEHVSKPAQFLDAVSPHVRPGGWIVLSTIARTWTSWVTTKLLAEDVLQIVPRGTHDWEKYVNEEELRAWFLGQPGWEQVQCMGCAYVPGVGWKEIPGGEKVGNYFFAARKAL